MIEDSKRRENLDRQLLGNLFNAENLLLDDFSVELALDPICKCAAYCRCSLLEQL